jgi:hypothetical protein
MRVYIATGITLALAAAALAGEVTVGGKDIRLTLPFCGT